MLPCRAECLGQHLADLRPEGRTAVDKDRCQNKRLFLGGVLEPGTPGCLPGLERAYKKRVRRARPVGVGVKATSHEDLSGPQGKACEVWPRRRIDVQGSVISFQEHDGTVEIRARDGLAPSLAPKGEPCERRRSFSDLCQRELDGTTRQGVRDDGEHGLDVERGYMGAVHAHDHGRKPRRHLSELGRVACPRDRPAERERRVGLRLDEIGITDHAEHRAGRREDGEVAKAPVKHVEQNLARQSLRRHRLGRRRHRLSDRRLGREPDG